MPSLPFPLHRSQARLRWNADLHERFVDAVTQHCGPDKATTKTIMRTMGVKGLTLCHLKSHSSFIPINILSQLHNIGGNLEHGKEEDAHEFMRFAIDKMQSVFLNEFGGEMAAHPRYPETSLVQHIFGGCLQSQVICSKCNNVSIQFEHMMDLTVEINGDAESLEECLD